MSYYYEIFVYQTSKLPHTQIIHQNSKLQLVTSDRAKSDKEMSRMKTQCTFCPIYNIYYYYLKYFI